MPLNEGNEQIINSGFTAGTQNTYPSDGAFFGVSGDFARSARSIAMAPNGDFVVVWSSIGQDDPTDPVGWGVYARRYSADGTPKGDAFRVNTITQLDQVVPSVAIDAAGNFIVTWSSFNLNTSDNSDFGVFARRFDSSGQAIGTAEFRVNTTTSNSQLSSVVAMDRDDDAGNASDGGFVITWTSQGQDGSGLGVFAQRYNSAGVAQGPEIAVTSVGGSPAQTAGDQLNSSVVVADDGSFVVIWESSQGDGVNSGYGIFAQRFDAQGNAIGDRIQINSSTAGDQRKPSIAMAADGSFVVAWSSQVSSGDSDVFYRRFNPDGTPATNEQRANIDTQGSQLDVTVAMATNGSFVLSWSAIGSAQDGVYARRFDASGNPLAGEDGAVIRLNTSTFGRGSYSSIAASNNSFAAVWTGNDGNGEGVIGRVYSTGTPTDNEPPTNLTLTPVSGTVPQVAENAIAAVVGTLSAIDPEGGDITFTVSGDDRFEVLGNQLKLKAGRSLDFENPADKSISLTVTATDNGTPSQSTARIFTVTTTNVNEAPINVRLDNLSLDENSEAGTRVGLLSADDPEGNTVTFSIANNPFYELDGNEIVVKDGANLNFEDPLSQSVQITVTATDNGTPPRSSQQTFTITLRDVNEVPVNIQLVGDTVAENVAGADIGAVTATDPDGTAPILSVADDRFEIVGGRLKLKAGQSLNYEDLRATDGRLTIEIIATDSQNAALQSRQPVTITVTDVNEAPENIRLTNQEVIENTPGAIVGRVEFDDPEGNLQILTVVGDDRFEIDAQGNLKLKAGVQLDREAAPTINVTVRASDANNTSLFAQQTFAIAVLNQNEPPNSILLTASPIDENDRGADVGAVTATDPDGTTPILSVSDPRFEIVNGRLKLRDDQSLNYEELQDGKLSLIITATDSVDPTKTFSRTFEITVNNVNEAPDLTVPTSGSVLNDATGVVIGTVTFSDPEGDSVTLTVSDDRFEVVNGQLKLKDNQSLDFDTDPQVTVDVIASDGNLETRRTVTIDVVPPGTPTEIRLSKSTIAEATSAAVVGTVTVTDEDSGTHTFTLSDDRFEIITVSGQYQLRLKPGQPPLDFETATGTIPLQITARDDDGREITRSFNLQITDVNEAPTGITIDNLTVDEQQFGAEIGAITVADPDRSESFIYTLSDDRFEVVSGRLKLKDDASLDINDGTTIDLTITARDKGGLETSETFTITVDPVNFAPTDITLSKDTLDEDTSGATVGRLTVVDADRGDTHSFSFGNDARFEVDAQGNLRLKDGVQVDFESEETIDLAITATDSGNPTQSFTKTITIRVNDLNDAPILSFTPAPSIAENATGATIGTLTATDPENNSLTFQISGALSDRFEIATVNGVRQLRLKAGASLDFESLQNGAVSLTVTATDNGAPPRQTTLPIAFQVTDVNEAPTVLNLSNTSVSEQVAGAEIGLVQVTDPDRPAVERFRYEVSDDRFEIVNGRLKLKDGVSLDADTTPTVQVTVTAFDRGDLSITREFQITVDPINLPPNNISLDKDTVNEDTLGAIVGKLTVTDPDRSDIHTFTIDDDRFEVDAQGNLKLKADAAIDFETEASVTLEITATDSGNPAQSFTQSVTIKVNDLNDAPALSFTPAGPLDENVAGATIGTINLSDADGDTVTLTISGDPADRFMIEGNQLKLKPGVSFDYEALTDGKLTITLIATDDGNPAKTTELPITITVTNVNEAPTAITLSQTQIDEGIPANEAIATLNTLDPDRGEQFTYRLVDGFGDNSAFVIEGNQLRIRQSPDFETKSSYQIQIISTDRGGLSSSPQTFTISVRDLNEAPTNITLAGNRVAENAAGAIIGNLSVTDPDSNQFTYTVSDDRFEVVNGQLKLKVGQSLNFEAGATLQLDITAIDNGTPVGRFTKAFTIEVTNVNEAPSAIGLDRDEVAENTPGAIVGRLSVTDPDAGDSATLSLGGDDRFEIDAQGNLKLKAGISLNSEDPNPVRVTVTATDRGGLTRSETFTISVTNLNEPPTLIRLSNNTVAENAAGANIGDLTVSDPDSDSFTFTVSDPARFEVVNGKLKLRAGQSLDFESGRTITLDVTAIDDGNPTQSFTQQFTINVTNVNEAPTEIRLLNDRVAENSAGAIVGQVQTIDPDAGDRFTYRVSDDRFEIDAQGNLKLKSSQQLDAEVTPTIALDITATDQGGLTRTQRFTLTVTDQNEPPTSLTLNGTTVAENAAPNTPVGTFTATDTEGGSFRYSLVSGVADNAAFTITGDRLLVRNPLDFETKNTYAIQVAVTDEDGLSLTRSFEIRVSNVNEAPTISPATGSLTYQENAGAVAIDPSLSLVDVDSQTLSGAAVRIINYVAGQDRLSFTAQSGISGQFNATTGILTLQGAAAVSAYQAVLRSIAYTNSSDAPNLTNRILQFTASDSTLTSQIATRTIQITPVNDAAIITPSIASVDFSLETRALELDAAIEITDVDSPTLSGATIALEGYVAGEDNLLFNDQNGIIGSFSAASGILTLTGTASTDAYEQAMRSVLYLNSSVQPTAQPRAAMITVNDGSNSDPARIQLQFQPSVAPPLVDLNGGSAGSDFSNTFVILGQPVAIASSDTRLIDSDSTVLTAAQIRITNLFDPDREMLLLDTAGSPIAASYDRPTGTLNLSGVAPLSEYVKLIQQIRYHNVSPAPDMTTRVILFRVSDGSRLSNAAQTTIQMTDIRLNDGTGGIALETTPATDRISAPSSNDTVLSLLANLQQNDLIDGGGGIDTLTLTDGSGNARIEIANPTNQISGVLVNNTIVRSFEQFNWSGFSGSITLIGSDANDGMIAGSGADDLSGGAGDDRLIGNGGNDRLDGGSGADYLEGGTGDDLYFVDNPADLVVELEPENGGLDTVSAAIDYQLPSAIEDLILIGGALNGIGNALDNGLTGNSLNNVLTGGLGDDLLIGNDGSDTLVGEDGDDLLIGDLGNDRLIGGNGNDRLEGGIGRDRLTGGSGKDVFVLNSSQRSNRDTITDFSAKGDTILISRRSFGQTLRRGRVRAGQFVLGNQAQDEGDRFIYSKGLLFYDRDGSGDANQVLIARLSGRPTIGRSDLVVIQ